MAIHNTENEKNARRRAVAEALETLQNEGEVFEAMSNGSIGSYGDRVLCGTISEDGTFTKFFAIGDGLADYPVRPATRA
jgi:hypothetical protein